MFTEGVDTDLSQFLLRLADSCDEMAWVVPEGDTIAKRLTDLAAVARAEAVNVEKPFRLGVVGMFKSGKSSVLNTFLRRKVLQEGRTETTSVLTELRFADSPEKEHGVVEYYGDRSEERSVEEALEFTDVRSEVFRDLSEDDKRRKQESIKQITLHLHCDLLRTLNLLDTPGFGGSAVGDRKAFDALQEVDAALMVFSADRVGAQDELEVADALSRAKRPIVALLNKVDDGHGEFLGDDQLEAPEAFLKDHFRTLVRGDGDEPLIFRYSALEVWKALEMLQRSNLSQEEGKAAVKALETWGFCGHGEGEPDRGVIEFLRSRYFADDRKAHRRKLEQAEGYVRDAIRNLVESLNSDLSESAELLQSVEAERTDVERRQEQYLEGKIAQIESEIGDVVDNCLAPLSLQLEEALGRIISHRSELDLSDLVTMARSADRLAEQVKEEFEEEFPSWEVENFVDDVQRRLHRLMKREWKLIVQDLQDINPTVELPDVSVLLEDVDRAIRNFSLALATYIATDLALFFVPGGQIVAVVQLLALGTGFYQTQKHKRALKEAKRKTKAQVRNHARKMRQDLMNQALGVNDGMAKKARSALWTQVEQLNQEVNEHRERQSRLREVRRDLAGYLDVLAGHAAGGE